MYTDIKLEKGLYSITGKTFTQALAELDPDSAYENTELKGLDAFERQLKRFDIKVSGADSDIVDKFFQTSSSAVLFPEYVSRAVKAGMDYADVLPDITASVTNIDGMDYRSIVSSPEDGSKELKVVNEGAFSRKKRYLCIKENK